MSKKVAHSTDPGFVEPRIDPEFRDLFEVLMDEKEDHKLEAMLLEEGEARDPIIVWVEENIVVEGHRRSKFCRKHNLPYTVRYRSFDSRDAVKKWMIEFQLHGRRNLTDAQRNYFLGKEYNATEASSAEVAKKNKTSRRRVFRAAKFAEAADAHEAVNPGALKKILTGPAGRSQERVIKTAPVLCARCVRLGRPVVDCQACKRAQEQAAKRKPKPKKDLFEEPAVRRKIKEEEPPKSLGEQIEEKVTQLASLFTRYLATPEGGEVEEYWDRLRTYMTWCGLLWFEKKDAEPTFLPLAGVRAVMSLAGLPGPVMRQTEVVAAYEKAAGVFIPPKTRDYRRRRG